MKLLSVNVSLPKSVLYNNKTVKTGIFKNPVNNSVKLGKLNLEGDGQADSKAHGGINKAVYAYPFEHYAFWQKELDRNDFTFGQFGENFTVEGMLEKEIKIGDIFTIGASRVQVTQPRIPCFKLAIKMNLPEFPELFIKSGKLGFYLRVLHEGEVGAGDNIALESSLDYCISVDELWYITHSKPDPEKAKKALSIEWFAPEWKKPLEKQIIKPI